jgi:hypothetical protein
MRQQDEPVARIRRAPLAILAEVPSALLIQAIVGASLRGTGA